MRKVIALAILAAAGLAAAGPAAAHGDIACNVPRAERRPAVELQKELHRQGWTVRRLEKTNGCYEVYGYDANGKKVEAFFDPKTFERVRQ